MDNIVINLDDNIGVSEDTLPRIGYTDDIISQSDTIVGPAGPQGPAGPAGADGAAATITVGTTTTGAAGTNAVVQNVGTSSAAILNFTIPRGATGATGPAGPAGADGLDGDAATITIGSVQTVAPEYPATVTNSGSVNEAILDFEIPHGATGETGPAGPAGADGAAATITVGSTTTGAAGTNASVTNSGTSSAAVLDFTIPRGESGPAGADGRDGNDGAAATIAVGTVTTGAAGSSATVTNSGTSSAAILDFTIPRGNTGETGSAGPQGPAGPCPVITATAAVNAATGTPYVNVYKTGTDEYPLLDFAFGNLKGETGATGPQGPSGVSITTKTDTGGRVGYYFDDGLLICRRTVTFNVAINTSWGSLYRGVNPDFYSFAPSSGTDFIEKPSVSVTALAGGTSSYWLGAWENGAIAQTGTYNMWAIPTGSLSFLRPSSSSSTPVILEIIAIGKWK